MLIWQYAQKREAESINGSSLPFYTDLIEPISAQRQHKITVSSLFYP